MTPLKLFQPTQVLTHPSPLVTDLEVFVREVDGFTTVESCWEPSSEELEALNRGAAVRVSVWGTTHPPLKVSVTPV